MEPTDIAAYRRELDKERLSYLYKLALDRRGIIGELALLALKSLILLNGGAIVALFTVLAQFDRLTVQPDCLWWAFGIFSFGIVGTLVALLLAFLASNDHWMSEAASAEQTYFHSIGDAQVASGQQQSSARLNVRGNNLWIAAVIGAAVGIVSFGGGSGAALMAVHLKHPKTQPPKACAPPAVKQNGAGR